MPASRTGKTKKKKVVRRKYVCSHCLCHEFLTKYESKRAARPRCSNCGGPLNLPREAFEPGNHKKTELAPQSPREERRSKRAKKNKARTQRIKRLQSMSTKLWFGVHKGQTVRDLMTEDPTYLQFLAKSKPQGRYWRMRALVDFLQTLHI